MQCSKTTSGQSHRRAIFATRRFVLLRNVSGQFVRQKASHRQYKYPGCKGLLNFQSDNGRAKGYQVKQLLGAIEELGLTLD